MCPSCSVWIIHRLHFSSLELFLTEDTWKCLLMGFYKCHFSNTWTIKLNFVMSTLCWNDSGRRPLSRNIKPKLSACKVYQQVRQYILLVIWVNWPWTVIVYSCDRTPWHDITDFHCRSNVYYFIGPLWITCYSTSD